MSFGQLRTLYTNIVQSIVFWSFLELMSERCKMFYSSLNAFKSYHPEHCMVKVTLHIRIYMEWHKVKYNRCYNYVQIKLSIQSNLRLFFGKHILSVWYYNNRTLITNKKLYHRKLVDSDLCQFCKVEVETVLSGKKIKK